MSQGKGAVPSRFKPSPLPAGLTWRSTSRKLPLGKPPQWLFFLRDFSRLTCGMVVFLRDFSRFVCGCLGKAENYCEFFRCLWWCYSIAKMLLRYTAVRDDEWQFTWWTASILSNLKILSCMGCCCKTWQCHWWDSPRCTCIFWSVSESTKEIACESHCLLNLDARDCHECVNVDLLPFPVPGPIIADWTSCIGPPVDAIQVEPHLYIYNY